MPIATDNLLVNAHSIDNIFIKPVYEMVFIISHRALALEGDYEMMPVCAFMHGWVGACVSHADFSKTATATDFLCQLTC